MVFPEPIRYSPALPPLILNNPPPKKSPHQRGVEAATAVDCVLRHGFDLESRPSVGDRLAASVLKSSGGSTDNP